MARNFIYYVAVTIAKLRLQLQSCDYPEKIAFVAFRISNTPSAFRKCYLSKKYIDNHIFTLYNIYHLVVAIDKALEYF